MGKTYKDREAQGRPRVPEWARPKPTIVHKNAKQKRQNGKNDFVDCREEYYHDIYENDD